MRRVKQFLVCFLACTLVVQAQGNTFNKVRYNGGSVDSKVNPKDWDNRLTVASDTITLALKDGSKLEILPSSVKSLSYGQEAPRRVGTMIALAVLVAPVALFGLFHKTKLHYIGIQYATPDGKAAGILLQGHKDNYRAILVALQGVTGVPLAVGEKERGDIPVGVRADVTQGESEEKVRNEETAESKPAATRPTEPVRGVVNVSSNPTVAEVLVDGNFVGNSPAALKLTPGKHTVVVRMPGYKAWSREITVQSGSEVQLTANLEKPEPLSKDVVQTAIDSGKDKAKNKCKDVGLWLFDRGGYTYHSIWIYTPQAWVERQSCQAVMNNRAVSLTEADVENSLHVHVAPRVLPKGARSYGACPLLRTVVLGDESGKSVLQPKSEEKEVVHVGSLWDWGLYDCEMIVAKFWMSDVAALRALSPDAEFLVGVASDVVGRSGERTWKVQKKHFKQLP